MPAPRPGVSLSGGTARFGAAGPLPAFSLGFGTDFTAGRIRMFAEARAFMTDNHNIRSQGSALLSLVLGVRF